MKAQRKKLRVKNKTRFALFVTVVIIVLIVVMQTIVTSNTGQQTLACSNDYAARPEPQTIYIAPQYTEKEVEMLAKTVYGEAYVTNSQTEMSAVVWCILNRVDTDGYGCGHDIEYVITFPGQFSGYNASNPVKPEIDTLVRDVLDRWYEEKNGCDNVGRTLPKDYLYFIGDGRKNHYTKEWKSNDYWNWSLETPYES